MLALEIMDNRKKLRKVNQVLSDEISVRMITLCLY